MDEFKADLAIRGTAHVSDLRLFSFLIFEGKPSKHEERWRTFFRNPERISYWDLCQSARMTLSVSQRARLLALCESVRRCQRPEATKRGCAHAADVYALMKHELLGLNREKVWVLPVDARSRLLRDPVCISQGSLMTSVIHPREVFGACIEAGAAAFVLVHNHPSGDPTPSVEDHQVTVRINDASKLMGIRMLDHIVVAEEGFKSFQQEGWVIS